MLTAQERNEAKRWAHKAIVETRNLFGGDRWNEMAPWMQTAATTQELFRMFKPQGFIDPEKLLFAVDALHEFETNRHALEFDTIRPDA